MNTIVSQQRIGYQRDNHGGLRSVFVSHWRDGTTTYCLEWADEDGTEHSSGELRTCPHIDVDVVHGPQQAGSR